MIELGQGQKRSAAPLPFPAIVGQEELKRALLAVAVAEDLDGVLVRGEKGTAKSTAVRALADLLPTQRAVVDCPYGCHPEDRSRQCADCRERADPPIEERDVPLVTLPLGATRDRVVGTLSVSDALAGEAEFDPGLLARANRGILYVDEVNLLDDHLVDVLLDAAASGVNRVERDGVSVTHPADITLIGTMNPEEGDLRPQLKDRFALQATVTGCRDVEDRLAVMDRALGNGHDDFAADVDALRERVVAARARDPDLPEEFARDIAELCRDAGVEGHRADIATARTAMAIAALEGRETVIESDVREAAEFTLPHRLQSKPFEDAPDPEDVLDDHFEDGEGEGESDAEQGDGEAGGNEDEPTADGDGEEEGEDDAEAGGEGEFERDSEDDGENGGPSPTPGSTGETEADTDVKIGDSEDAPDREHDGEDESEDSDAEPSDQEEGTPLVPGQDRAGVGEASAPEVAAPETNGANAGGGSGTRAVTTPSTGNRGARVRTERTESGEGVDAAASVRAAATRGSDHVERRDLRNSVRAGTDGALVVFAVDVSASMAPAMRAAKGVLLSLLEDAYEQRDEVAFVAIGGEESEVALPPTDSVSLAGRHLKDLPTGDRTPLPDGIDTAGEVVDAADADSAVVVLVTDGRANVAEGSPSAATRAAARRLARRECGVVVVDAGNGGRADLTDLLVRESGGERVPLEALTPERVEGALADQA